MYWYGSTTFYPLDYHMFSLPVFTAGVVLVIFNAETLRVLAFPIAFLLFLAVPPFEIVAQAAAAFAAFSSEVSHAILRTLGLPVTLATEYGAPALVVTDPSGSSIRFVIGVASSGIESIIGFSIFATFLTYISRGPAWKRITLFFANLPIIYALTIIRVMMLVSVGHWQGATVAWDIFHLLGGPFFIILGTITLIILAEKVWKIQIFTTKPDTTPCPSCSTNTKNKEPFCPNCGKLLQNTKVSIAKQDAFKIATLIIAAVLVTSISVPVFVLAEGPPNILVQSLGSEQPANAGMFPEVSDYQIELIGRDPLFEQLASRDRALIYAYIPTNSSTVPVYIALEIGSLRSTWHSWEASVYTYAMERGHTPFGMPLESKEIQLLQNPPLKGRFFAFQQTKTNTTEVVLYWYESILFNANSTSEQKYVKTSLVVFPEGPEAVAETEGMLLMFAEAIVNYWQPMKIWSQISMAIAENGVALTAMPATMIAAVLVFQFIKKSEEKKSNLRMYRKLVPQERFVLMAAHVTTLKPESTLDTIAEQYHEITGKTIDSGELAEKLEQAEKAGLMKKDLASRGDRPIIVWKSLIGP